MIGFLIGFMGSGKSTLGRAVKDGGQIPFIDLDDYITVRARKPITAIFDEGGERLFRKLEKEALESLTVAKPAKLLIACGGGTPCFEDNMKLINESGASFYLKTPIESIYQRLLSQKAERPLIRDLSDEELKDFITNLLEKRESYYLQAKYHLEPEQQLPDFIYNILLNTSQ
ncbi:MAG: shikimate kinase [Bacteroidota bacterium]